MKTDTIQVGQLFRSIEFDRQSIDDSKRQVEMSFSSEIPVERWFGNEILDHSSSSVDMGRMASGAPLLVEHDRADQVGVIEKAWIDGVTRRGKAIVRFGSSARAQEIYNDVKDGIRRLVSVGYRVHKLITEKVENEVETLRAMRWEPMEISIVSVPADPSVGIGRGEKTGDNNTVTIERQNSMADQNIAPTIDSKQVRADIEIQIRNEQKQRTSEVMAITAALDKRHPNDPECAGWRNQALSGEMSIDDLRSKAFQKLSNATPVSTKPEIGMTERDIQDYSFHRAILCAARGKYEGLEGEMHQDAVKRYKMTERANGIVVPHDVLAYSKRDQLVGTASIGGNLVATQLLAGSFIELLRNRMIVSRLGATTLSGLQGNVAIPRQSGGATAYWAASEAAATTESTLTFDQVTMTPKQVTGRVDYSWLLMNQGTPSVEGIVRNDLLNVLARAVDLAALHGSGSSGQPTGIAATSGIGSVAGGTNGAAPTWANIVGLETEVAIDNADIGTLGYVTNAKARGKLKTTLKGSTTAVDGIYILGDERTQDGFGMLNGYNIGFSNQVASNLTKGTSTTVCSAIFFGNWADLMIGQWSGIELLVNPYTQAANRVLEVYAYQALDIAVRHPESFAAMLDALTT